MRVTILGTGAMSCLIGARLAAVAEVTLAGTWKEGVAAIQSRGIILEEDTATRAAQARAVPLPSEIDPAPLVLVLVKAWQTPRIAGLVTSLLSPGGIVLTLQNGLGNLEILGPAAHLGVTAEGATLLGPGRVRRAGASSTHIAAPIWVVELFLRAGFKTFHADETEAQGLLWGKLSVSCGINALTALLRVHNGELLRRADASVLMERAALECAAVAHARGITLPFSDPVERVRQVAKDTASNRSSMFQDILRGAPTECEAINGAVVREGRKLGVPTPVNEILWRLVKATVSGSATRSGERGDFGSDRT